MSGLCPECITGNKLAGTPKGISITEFSLPVYFASPTARYEPPLQYTKKALVISPDVFGFGIDNPKLLADIFAEKCGMDVWAVDTFRGKPPVSESEVAPYLASYAGEQFPWYMTIVKYVKLIPLIPTMYTYRSAVQEPWLIEFIGQLRKECGYEKIGLIGYCWGGSHAVNLASQPGIIDAAFPCHPGGNFKDNVLKAVVPITYSIPEEDRHWPSGVLATVMAEFEARADAPKHSFKVYPGTAHGFGSRPNFSIPKVKESWEEYISDTVAWIQETL